MPSGANSHRLRNSARLGDALSGALERKDAGFAVSLQARPNESDSNVEVRVLATDKKDAKGYLLPDLAARRLPKGTIITSASSTT